MLLDRPDVLAEVAEHFQAYERALVADDVDAVVGFFAPGAVRFGLADQQVGLAEQARWRRAQPPLPPGRRLHDTRIAAYGADIAVVTTLFDYPGGTVSGRQSQTWVRLPDGWRIVTAHVSEPTGPSAAPVEPVPDQPVPGQPVPGQPVPGQPVPGQPVPDQPVSANARSMSSVNSS